MLNVYIYIYISMYIYVYIYTYVCDAEVPGVPAARCGVLSLLSSSCLLVVVVVVELALVLRGTKGVPRKGV